MDGKSVLMAGICVPINNKARTIVLFSRSLVTNVGSLSDLLGVTWVEQVEKANQYVCFHLSC